MFDFLKDKLVGKEIMGMFWTVLKVMFTTGLLKMLKDTGSIEIFEMDGSLVVGLNAHSKREAVKEVVMKIGQELVKVKMPTCDIQMEDGVVAIYFNHKYRELMEEVTA